MNNTMQDTPVMWDGSEYEGTHTAKQGGAQSSGLDFSPIESTDISTIVKHIVESSGCRQKGSRLDKIIRLSTDTKSAEQKVRTGVYQALGLAGAAQLITKNDRILEEIHEGLKYINSNKNLLPADVFNKLDL